MKPTGQELEAEVPSLLKNCLEEVPFCTLKSLSQKSADEGVDFVAKLRVEGEGEKVLILQVKASGQPRSIREAANALSRYRPNYKNAYGVVIAPFISEASAEILAKENIGYVDLAGNCRFSLDRIYIRKEGNSNRFTEKRDLRSLYSPKAERVLRVLMLEPKRPWLVQPLSEAAEVSLGQVSNVKKLLDEREWVRAGERGFMLSEPEALLEEWYKAYRFTRSEVGEFYAMSSLEEIERAVGKEGCLTGFSAAARYAPQVRYQRAAAYVREPMDAVAQKLGWKRVPSGGNVSLIEPYDDGVFQGEREVDGLRIASPVQTYLDVRGNVARGEEAAEAILREVLKPTW